MAGTAPPLRDKIFRRECATPMVLILSITEPMSAIGVARSRR
jgi:hypothetical protein